MPDARSPNWTREQTLVAFRLYCTTPFGKLSSGNPEIVRLSRLLGRTPGAVGMKACNFASLDPLHRERGVVGLSNRSKVEERIWDDFEADSASVAEEAERAYETLLDADAPEPAADRGPPSGETETVRVVKARRVQRFFRSAVLNSYGHRCALTGLGVPALLNASHIVPWAARETTRADPRNGLCLNALHDRAFDRGLLAFGGDLRAVVSPAVANHPNLGNLAPALRGVAGKPLRTPDTFAPDRRFLAFHRERVFQAA